MNMNMMKESNTRNEIMEVALKLFEKFGYEKTSIDDIAKQAHKAKGSIYYNFKGKFDIYKALVVQEFATIELGLIRVCERFAQQGEEARQVIEYLLKRMELLDKASMYKQTLTIQHLDSNSPLVKAVREIRSNFDRWEWSYFVRICEEWTKAQVLSPAIQPNSFADMLQMVLKGLELHFFSQNSYAFSKQTYENMVIIILNTMAGGRAVMNNNQKNSIS